MKTKKVYKVRHIPTNQYIALGYNSKTIWGSFPSQAIKYSHHISILKDCVVDVFEIVKTETLSITGEKSQF